MKGKRTLALLLAITMIFSTLGIQPQAFAATATKVFVGGKDVTGDTTMWNSATSTLTLNAQSITAGPFDSDGDTANDTYAGIYADGDITINLTGSTVIDGELTPTLSRAAAIFVDNGSVTMKGTGTLAFRKKNVETTPLSNVKPTYQGLYVATYVNTIIPGSILPILVAPADSSIKIGIELDKTDPPAQKFVSWKITGNSVNDNVIRESVDHYTMPAEDITLTAMYEPLYTLHFDLGNGKDPSTDPKSPYLYDINETAGADVWIHADSPIPPPGYIFEGWSTDGVTVTYHPSDYLSMPSNNVTLKAVYSPDPAATFYTLTYDAQGGTPAPATEKLAENETITLPDITTPPTGQVFVGWSDGTTTYKAGETFTMPAKDVTLTAQYTPVTYTLTYDAQGGTPAPVAEKLAENETITLPDITTPPTGQVFVGWSDGTTTYKAGETFTMPAKDVTLTAQYTPVTYTLTYDAQGGSPAPLAVKLAENATTTLPDIDTPPTGQVFAGWSDGTTTYKAGETFTMPAKDVTLTAQYTPVTYTLTYDA
ncbi:InlB B-repeat-containing protein, partial [Guggenheimella bovis]